jgi:transcription elongation factor GreA
MVQSSGSTTATEPPIHSTETTASAFTWRSDLDRRSHPLTACKKSLTVDFIIFAQGESPIEFGFSFFGPAPEGNKLHLPVPHGNQIKTMSNISYFTKEGLQNLKDEVRQLETVERPKISGQIAEARDKGDLSENAEYDAAKEAQGLLEAKISKLKNTLANARLVDDSQIDNSKVYILSTVRIKNMKNNAEVTYTLVAENEANLALKKISIDSPIGKGLLGKAVGEIAEVQVPAGLIPFEVLEISRNS